MKLPYQFEKCDYFCRREKFEQLLNDYQAEVDVYQEKEVPRHLEDIKKVVAQLEQLSQNLEKSKDDAMVSQGHNVAGLEFYTCTWCREWGQGVLHPLHRE